MKRRWYIGSIAALLLMNGCAKQDTVQHDWNTISEVFVQAPDTIQTSVYWYWISDNVSKQGVINDLHAMKKAGINRAFIGNIGLDDLPEGAYGKVKLFTDEWWEVIHTALKTATELNIEIGIFNSPGWSQSGGPWVKPNEAMRYLASKDTLVSGPVRLAGKLPAPGADFEPVEVLAFPAPRDYKVSLASANPRLTATPAVQSLTQLMDGNRGTEARLSPNQRVELTASVENPFTARSLTVYPAGRNMAFNVTLLVKDGDGYKSLKSFRVDRSNNALNVGFEQFAPVTVSFNAVTASEFRIVFDAFAGDVGIAEVELHTAPRVERFKEKSLARMHPTPLPYWHDYQWERQAEPDDASYVVNPTEVVNLTKSLGTDGELNWEVPEGDWVILYTGMMPTGVTNSPASPEGRGLEIDKMSRVHVAKHFDAFLGEILRRVPAEDRKTFKIVVEDSYETGGQNWTDDFIPKFQKAMGYDPTPYVPALYGYVVGSQEQSDRFLWDVRRFIADNVAYEYVGGLRDISHKHGLTTWLENYGHWGFPGEFLQYGGQSDEVAGEFWSEGDLGNIENRAASSAAHIYGKRKVSAESFTAAGKTFARYPAMFKERGDRFFAEGINNSLLHLFIHQPYEDKRPGVNAWFGNEFNRFNTWYYDMDGFISYLKRSNFMLQQGRYVADVAYFIGEDAPKMTGVQDPALPKGYAFDYINAEVILNRLTLKDGRFTLPDGLSYKILVLPQLETIRPALLRKIEQLVKDGGVILGPKPLRSPSLADYQQADEEVKKLAEQLWGNIDGKAVTENQYGKGMVFFGVSLQEALTRVGVKPDVRSEESDPVVYLHRELKDGDIYFIANQSNQHISIKPTFRISGKQPEWWDGVKGTIRDLPQFEDDGNGTAIPLEFSPYESAFIVFRKPGGQVEAGRLNFPKPVATHPVDGSWELKFIRPDSSTFTRTFESLTDWTQHPDTAVNYFSGAAIYSKLLPDAGQKEGQRVELDLGNVIALAKVTVNGQYIGNTWTPPYKVDITHALKASDNRVEIKVVNTWANRLIGDQRLPQEKRSAWTIINPYKAESPLWPAGLLGPVQLLVYDPQ